MRTPITSKLNQNANRAKVGSDQAPHVIVKAGAGTGKTTTLAEGLKSMRGLPTSITPSEQQRAVWQALAQSKDARTVAFVAFNKPIAEELGRRIPADCQAMTMHSMGLKAVKRAYPSVRVESYRVRNLISEVTEVDLRVLTKRSPLLVQATERLVGLCKVNLVGLEWEWDAEEGAMVGTDGLEEQLSQLAFHYGVDLETDDGVDMAAEIFDLVPQVLARCKEVGKDGCVDFDDMVWLPTALSLPVFKYDLLLVDEAQDLNRCQQALAKAAGHRLVLVGDPRQAIYGFAGADADSMPRMARELAATQRGCLELPLTVTRRCGKAIVKEANSIVKDFHAHEGNPDGVVGHARFSLQRQGEEVVEVPFEKTYAAQAAAGDMVLCRVNAPLVRECFRFLKRGRKAVIIGRDVAGGLNKLVRKLAEPEEDVTVLAGKLSDWLYKEMGKEQAKRIPDEGKIINLNDRADCICCFMEGATLVADVLRKIEQVFTDDRSNPGIRLSSIHKAKGLEADRVFFLEPERATCPHPMAKSEWQVGQEWNLRYVAITRAIRELVYVS